MGKRHNRESVDEFCFSVGSLFDNCGAKTRAKKLRRDIHATIVKQTKLVKLLRNEIPDALDSDARNVLQELTDRLTNRFEQAEDLVITFADHKISTYEKTRRDKKRQRRED